jgi:DNA-binding CsgD family transcriptional regulator
MTRRGRGRPPHSDLLTPAEQRVLDQLREGGTNAEIAVRLGVSPDAVKYHVSNMLGKLDLPDRHALAAWSPERERRRWLGLSVPASLFSLGRLAAALSGLLAVVVLVVVLLLLLGGGDAESEPVSVRGPDTPEDPAVHLFAGWSVGMCAVRESGALICWGIGFAAEGPPFFPDDEFRSADVGDVGVCGVRPSGELACWRRDRDSETSESFGLWARTPSPPGTFRTVGVGDEQACALARSGQLACWDANGAEVGAPPGAYRRLSVGDRLACAVRESGEIACWDDTGFEFEAPAGKYSTLAVGHDRACAIRESGELACWDHYGAEVEAPSGKYRSVSVSEDDSSRPFGLACAVRESGGVSCWTYTDLPGQFPGAQDGPPGNYVSVTVGRSGDVCAIRASGGVVCWGDWVRRVTDAPKGTYRSVSVEAHACAVRESGEVDCWGDTHYPWVNPQRTCEVFLCLRAGVLDVPPGRYRSVAVGSNHTCALRESGEIACWGLPRYGLTGAPPGQYRQLETAGGYACAIRESGEIACWTGGGTESVDAPAGTYRSLRLGNHACAIRESGEIDCWGDTYVQSGECGLLPCVLDFRYEGGDNDYGQLAAPPGKYRSVAVGSKHTCALRESGEVVCWGGNRFGETSAPPGKFRLLEGGDHYACATRELGEVACWGHGLSFWRVLAAPDLDEPAHAMDPPSGKFRSLSLGPDDACGIRESGEVACWGRNDWGQSDAPEGKFRSVSVGIWHVCGIRESGEVACWGGMDVPASLR